MDKQPDLPEANTNRRTESRSSQHYFPVLLSSVDAVSRDYCSSATHINLSGNMFQAGTDTPLSRVAINYLSDDMLELSACALSLYELVYEWLTFALQKVPRDMNVLMQE